LRVAFGPEDVPKNRVEFLMNINMKVVFIGLGRLFRGLLPKNIGLGVVWEEGKNLMEKRIKNRGK